MKNSLINVGRKARKALVRSVSSKKKDCVLEDFQKLILKNQSKILNENKKDLKFAVKKKLKESLIKRLVLDKKKILQIIKSIKSIKRFEDPINKVLEKWQRPNGLKISKVTIPLGVIGVIYESRPNVTSDVASLCFKSGNPVILKGGSEAFFTNKIITNLFRISLRKNKINADYVQFIEQKNRKVVDLMLSKMEKFIDVVIPRGGEKFS